MKGINSLAAAAAALLALAGCGTLETIVEGSGIDLEEFR